MKRWGVFIAASLLFFSASRLGALGLALRFVDITLENVEPGASFNLRVIRNFPMVVMNLDPVNDTDILIESELPNPNEMKEGYEPIPDPGWVRVVPNRFHLGPKASASSDVIVNVPNDSKLIGHHYEVILWAHTDARKKVVQGRAGVILQTGLRSRLRMSIGTQGPASLQREKAMKKLATINTNFSINPDSVFVQDVPLGPGVDLKSLKKVSLKVINEADEPVKLKFESAVFDANIHPQTGYIFTPDPAWMTVSPRVLNVPGNSIKEIKLMSHIPDKPENRGKKFMFLIRTTLAEEDLPLIYNNMIYIGTQP